jgi:purine-cytosine permease-like protein
MAAPSVLLLVLGAAIGGAVPNVPEWSAAYDKDSVGGVLAEMLTPARGFGKFIVVILALSVIGNIAVSMYSISLNIQMFHPFFTRVPRSIFSVITTVVLIPVSIQAAKSFFESLENFLGIISYWSASFVAIMMTEFIWFRKSDYSTYDPKIWNVGSKLPWGVAAICAGICSFGLVVPSMVRLISIQSAVVFIRAGSQGAAKSPLANNTNHDSSYSLIYLGFYYITVLISL